MTEPAVAVPRRARWGRRLAALALVVVAAGWWWAPPLLRSMAFFRVRHVEVRGARFTRPALLVERLQLDTTFSIWSPLDSLVAKVRAHPHVADARIARRFPGTLVVHVTEFEPVAWVSTTEGLRAHDASGRALGLDPSRTPVDLPVLARRDTAVLRLLADIRAADPLFFARVSEVRRLGPSDLVLQLVDGAIRVAPDVPVERLAQVHSVESDLASRGIRAVELDLRFRDQVIARLP